MNNDEGWAKIAREQLAKKKTGHSQEKKEENTPESKEHAPTPTLEKKDRPTTRRGGTKPEKYRSPDAWKRLAEGANDVDRGFPDPKKKPDGRDLRKEHWSDHKDKYKGVYSSEEEYEAVALRELNRPVGGKIEGFARGDGTIIRYNHDTNDMSTGSYEKGLIGMFKPKHPDKKAGYEYFLRNKAETEYKGWREEKSDV